MKAVDIMTSLTAVKTRQTSRQLQQHSEISDNRSNTTQFPTAKTVYSVILDSRSNTANQHFISFTSALTQFFLFTLKTALSVFYTLSVSYAILTILPYILVLKSGGWQMIRTQLWRALSRLYRSRFLQENTYILHVLKSDISSNYCIVNYV